VRKAKPWLISIPSLKQGENRLSFELDIEELGGTSHEVSENPSFRELVGPIGVKLSIIRTGSKLMVSGRIAFTADLQCALCGKGFRRSFSEQLASEFIEEGDAAAANKELDWEDLNQDLVQGNVLNLIGLVHDAIHLAIPIAPKCRPDCKGVCPVCGADLNEGTCRCG